MSVCDDKITKLKERIDSDLPTYSKEQIKRSRELTIDSSLKKQLFIQNLKEFPARHLFPGERGVDSLRKVFQDQTKQAILKSKEIANQRKSEEEEFKNLEKEHKRSDLNPDQPMKKQSVGQAYCQYANHARENVKILEVDPLGVKTPLLASEYVVKNDLKTKEEKESCKKAQREVQY